MITPKIKLFQLLLFVFLINGLNQVFAQYYVDIYNKSNRTVAIRINGNFQNNLEPGDSKRYSVNSNSVINYSLSETDKYVVQLIQAAAYQGNNWKFDWTQYQFGSSIVVGSGTINLLPELDADGTYLWVKVQVKSAYQQQTSYSSYDYEDDDEELVWYMVIGLVVGALFALIPM